MLCCSVTSADDDERNGCGTDERIRRIPKRNKRKRIWLISENELAAVIHKWDTALPIRRSSQNEEGRGEKGSSRTNFPSSFRH
jgi:hypothetical protein